MLQLTFLDLQDLNTQVDATALPPALAALPLLERFCCKAYPPSLPPGPWLTRLRWLAAPPTVVAASLPALAAAQQLECLCLLRMEPALILEAYDDMYAPPAEHGDNEYAAQFTVIEWAGQHPSLRRLSLGGPAWRNETLVLAIQQAEAASPQLRIELTWDMYRELPSR